MALNYDLLNSFHKKIWCRNMADHVCNLINSNEIKKNKQKKKNHLIKNNEKICRNQIALTIYRVLFTSRFDAETWQIMAAT